MLSLGCHAGRGLVGALILFLVGLVICSCIIGSRRFRRWRDEFITSLSQAAHVRPWHAWRYIGEIYHPPRAAQSLDRMAGSLKGGTE